MSSSTMPAFLNIILVIGVVISNYLCGLACITSCSRMMYAFARDGGLPFSKGLSHVSTNYRTPTVAIWTSGILALISCLYGGAFAVLAAGCAVFLYISYIMPIIAGFFAEGRTWKEKGPFNLGALSKPNAVLAILGGAILMWVGFQPPNDAVGRLIIGLVVFLVVLWFILERVAPFEGVPQGEKIAARQGMIAETEAKFKDSAAD
jgi:amino acid transporter